MSFWVTAVAALWLGARSDVHADRARVRARAAPWIAAAPGIAISSIARLPRLRRAPAVPHAARQQAEALRSRARRAPLGMLYLTVVVRARPSRRGSRRSCRVMSTRRAGRSEAGRPAHDDLPHVRRARRLLAGGAPVTHRRAPCRYASFLVAAPVLRRVLPAAHARARSFVTGYAFLQGVAARQRRARPGNLARHARPSRACSWARRWGIQHAAQPGRSARSPTTGTTSRPAGASSPHRDPTLCARGIEPGPRR